MTPLHAFTCTHRPLEYIWCCDTKLVESYESTDPDGFQWVNWFLFFSSPQISVSHLVGKSLWPSLITVHENLGAPSTVITWEVFPLCARHWSCIFPRPAQFTTLDDCSIITPLSHSQPVPSRSFTETYDHTSGLHVTAVLKTNAPVCVCVCVCVHAFSDRQRTYHSAIKSTPLVPSSTLSVNPPSPQTSLPGTQTLSCAHYSPW